MKYSVIISLSALLFILAGCQASNTVKEEMTYTVSGTMIHFPPQCSGTLTEDYLISTKALPLANTIFYVKKGDHNAITDTAFAEFKTDQNGYFFVTLPPGDYCLLHQFQKDTMAINAVRTQSEYYEVDDEGTIWQAYKTPIALIKIEDKNIDSLAYKINVQCFFPPGMQGFRYIGPMPE